MIPELHGAEGPPILLVMGLGMPGEMWAPLLPALSAGHALATFDHRGLGRHHDLPPASSMEELADDLELVLDRLGWRSAHLVGVSMGGMAVQELAIRRPHRVRSLALLATTAHGRRLALPTAEAAAAFALSRRREERLGRLLYPAAFRLANAAEVEARTARLAGGFAPAATVRAHFRAVLGHDARNRLGTLRVPTLVVKPALDALIRPRASDDLARRIPRARLVVLPDAGHGLVHQSAAALAELLARHVATAEAPAPR